MAIWEKQNEYHFLSLGCNCKNESNFYLLNVTSCDFLFNCDCSCVVNGLQMRYSLQSCVFEVLGLVTAEVLESCSCDFRSRPCSLLPLLCQLQFGEGLPDICNM